MEDWLEDKSCSIGDVTREEYKNIMKKAEEVYIKSRWMTIIDKDTNKERMVRWNPVNYPEDSAAHLTLVLEKFIPHSENLYRQISFAHALVRAFGGRPYWHMRIKKYYSIDYLFYRGRHFSPSCLIICLLSSERYQSYGFSFSKAGLKKSLII